MERCDVAIVGAGPAGATCAWKLKRAGFNVTVLDREIFPRDKVCAGWVTPAVLETLQIDAEDYARERILQPIRGFRVGLMGEEPVEIAYGEPVSYGIRRVEFDDFLLARSGARLKLGQRLEQLELSAEGWVINDSLQARMLVGAGGHFCPVARRLRQRQQSEVVVAAKEVEFEMSESERRQCQVREDVPELFFCQDLKGYAWCLRKGNFLNVGLGREDSQQLSAHVSDFIRGLRDSGRIRFDLERRLGGHAYLLYGRSQRAVIGERLLLIGDAAGLAYPQSGEGIRPAIESALMAAGTLIEADGDFSPQRLAPYRQRLRERFGASEPGVDWAPQGLKWALARRLLGSRWFARNVVLDRWFLHRHQLPLTAA